MVMVKLWYIKKLLTKFVYQTSISFQIYLQINIQISVILVVESNESLFSSAESNQLITIVPPVIHNSS